MTCQKIYEEAMNILGENADSEENEDFEERASYLLASFCVEMSELNRALLPASEEDTEASEEKLDLSYLPLDAEFPLVNRLSAPACLYLASMLVIDENSVLSDRLYDRYCDSIATICSSIPASVDRITDRYGWN